MDQYLTAQLLSSLVDGDLTKFAAYLAIFVFIWLEVRSLKKILKSLNVTITDSFDKGDKRFKAIEDHNNMIEKQHLEFEHRITLLELMKQEKT